MEPYEKGFVELLEIMARLRGPGGCPWDREQTHESLKKYLIEEAYEACEAIDEKNDQLLAEELGDVLLQVVFHAQIASEQGRFTMTDVLSSINRKLISRHPHVFGPMKLDTPQQVLEHWEKFKQNEREGRASSVLDGVPRQLPALIRAQRVQQKAARVGFDWEKVQDIFVKVREELREFEEACKSQDDDTIEDELGDLLFAVVNVARFLEQDPEAALQRTIGKFTRRFQYIEEKVKQSGKELSEVPLEIMDRYWEESKQALK